MNGNSPGELGLAPVGVLRRVDRLDLDARVGLAAILGRRHGTASYATGRARCTVRGSSRAARAGGRVVERELELVGRIASSATSGRRSSSATSRRASSTPSTATTRAASAPLADGDEVALIPPVSGGAFRLTERAADRRAGRRRRGRRRATPARSRRSSARRASSRAAATVVHLEYEAYEGMAEEVMARHRRGAPRRRYDLCKVAIHHRVGRVGDRRDERRDRRLRAAPRRTRSPPARRRSTRSRSTCRSGRRRSTRAARSGSAEGRRRSTVTVPTARKPGSTACREFRLRRRYDESVSSLTPQQEPETRALRARAAGRDDGEHAYRDYEPIHPRGVSRDLLQEALGADRRARPAPLQVQGGDPRDLQAQDLRHRRLDARLHRGLRAGSGAGASRSASCFLLLVHELGHVAELRRQGVPATAPLFIPFLGAVVGMKQMPHNVWKEAQVALGRPDRRQPRRGRRAGPPAKRSTRTCCRARLHRLLPQPLQPDPGLAARRRPRGRSAAPCPLGGRAGVAARADDPAPEPDPHPRAHRRRNRGLAPLARRGTSHGPPPTTRSSRGSARSSPSPTSALPPCSPSP